LYKKKLNKKIKTMISIGSGLSGLPPNSKRFFWLERLLERRAPATFDPRFFALRSSDHPFDEAGGARDHSRSKITTDIYLYLLYLTLYISLSVYLFDVIVCISYFILVALEFTFEPS
jgi:hypothetical protein